MKNERKPKPPVIAAPDGTSTGKKTRGSRVSSPASQPPDFSTLPLQNPYPVMRLAQDGQPLFGNAAAASLLGFSMDEAIPEDWRAMVGSTLETGSTREMDIERDGRIFSALFVPVQSGGYVNVYCSDRTDLYRTQASLRESEERFRLAADASGALVYEVDLRTGSTAIVHGLERLSGYDPQEVAVSSEWWHSLIHPDDLSAHLSELDELLKQGGTDVCEYRILHQNGRWITVQDNRLVIRNEAGDSVRLIGAVTDISERKQMEQILQAHDAELQDMINKTPFMLTRCTRDLRYRFVSRTYAELLGRAAEDIAGKSIVEIMGAEAFETIRPYVEQVLNGQRVESETEIQFQGGARPTLHVIYTPDTDEQGKVIGWFESIVDVSARRAAEVARDELFEQAQQQRQNAEEARRAAEEATAEARRELSERRLAESALGSWITSPLPEENRPDWLRYGAASLAAAVAILIRQLLDPVIGEYVNFTTIFGAIAFSVWFGGTGPGMLSAILGYVGIAWLVMDWAPLLSMDAGHFTSLLVFMVSSLIILSLGQAMRRAQRHAHQSARVAVERQRQAEARLVEKQRAEDELRESEQRFRGIFETAGVSVWLEDFSEVKAAIEELRAQGVRNFEAYFKSHPEFVQRAIGLVRILDVNNETLDLFEADSKDQLLESLHTVFLPETTVSFVEELIALAAGRKMVRSEAPVRTLDGRLISVIFTAHFGSYTSDQSHVVITLTDITERKHAEQALAREREVFKRLFETMPVMSSMYDPETETLRLNAEFERLSGWKAEEVDVRSLLSALYPDPEYMQDVLARIAAAAGKNEWVDVRMQTREGRILDTLWANISIMNDEKLITGISLGIDITERKRMEQRIRESEERYRAIVSQTTAGIAESDTESRLIFVNPRLCEMLGYSQDELVGKTIWELTHTDDLEQNKRLFSRLLERGQSYQFEKRFIRKNGSHMWANVSVSPIYGASGQPRGGVGVIIDIEERKQAEQEIHRLNAELQSQLDDMKALMEILPTGVWIGNEDCSVITGNPAAYEILGLPAGINASLTTAAPQTPPNLRTYVNGQEVSPEDAPMQQVARSGKPLYNIEHEVLFANGIRKSVYASIVPLFDQMGNVRKVIGAYTDFSERKQMEEALRVENERFMRFVNSNIVGIVIGEAGGELTLVNDYFLNLLGVTRQEFNEGKVDWKRATPPEWLAADEKSVRELRERGASEPYEKEYLRPDGTRLQVYIANALLPGPGEELGAFVIDISARKRAEEALRSSEERMRLAIEANRMVAWEWDPNADQITTSANFHEVYGLSSISRLEDGFSLVWPQDEPAHREKVDRVARQGGEYQSQFRITRPDDGRVIWLEERARAMTVPEGKVTRLVGVVNDVTERKHAEQSMIEYARQQRALYKLAERLQHTEGWNQVYDAAVDAIMDAVQCQRASILLFDNTNRMRFVAWSGLSDAYRQATDGHSPWTVEDQNPSPILYEDVDKSDLSAELKAVIRAEGICALAFIPLVPNGSLLGKFMLYFNAPHKFTDAEIDLSLTIARQLAFDIARKRAEEQLRASESLYRAIARNIPGGGVYVVDKDFRYLVAEGPVTEAFGLSRQMLEGRTVAEVFPDERGARMEGRLRRNFAGETVDFETHFNGRHYWTQQAPLQNSIGQAIILTLDITERKRAEEELRSSEERMRLAIEANRMVSWEWDPVADVVTTSANIHEVYGLTDVETKAAGFALIWPEDLPAHQKKVEHVLQNGGEYHSEFRITRPVDGRVLWMEERARAIMDTDRKVTRLVGIVIDVTERKRAEEELRVSEQRLRLATQAAGMFSWDSNLIAGTIQWSENAAQVIGCNPDELPSLAAHSRFFVSLEDEERVLNEYMVALTGQQTMFTSEFRGRGEPETAKYFLMHGRFLRDGKGEAVRLVGVTQDITERKHAEEALRKAREEAVETADRITRLQEITAALAGSLGTGQLAELILEQGTRATGAAAGILVEVVNNGKEWKTVAALGYPEAAIRREAVPLSDRTPLADCIQTRQAIWIESNEEFAIQYPSRAEFGRGLGIESTVAMPLILGDRVVGGLAFSFAEKREFLLEERGFLLAVAQQCVQALERVRAAEALRESEQRFAGFMQHLPGLAWIKDLQGRYVFANDAAEKAFRISREQLYGHTDLEVFPPHIADQFRRNDEQTLIERKGIQIVEELEHEDGLMHYSLVNKFPIFGSDGAATLIGGMAIDITERRQAEERLLLLSTISELTRDIDDPIELMAAVADLVGRQLRVKRCLFNEIDIEHNIETVHNDYHNGLDSVAGMHKLTDYSDVTTAEMMAGKTIVNYDAKLDPRTAQDYERSYVPTGERAYVAVPLRRDEQWVASLWVSDDRPRPWTSEEVALLETIAERTWTATEKLRINAALRDSEERLRVTFNTTAVGFATLRPDTRFVEVNEAFCKIVGYSREELLEMNYDALTHPAYQESTREHIRQLLAGIIPSFVLEKLYVRKGGSEIWVQNSVSVVRDEEGAPLHLIAICQDITERKQAEEWERKSVENLAAAAEANAKFRVFFDQGSYFAGVMALDGTLVEANRLSLEFCGFRREETIGRKFWDCGWWSPSQALVEMIKQGIRQALEGTAFRTESNYFLADGSERYIDLIITPVKDDHGNLLFLAPTGTDITERKRAEKELRRLNLALEERVERRTQQLKTAGQLRRMEMVERKQAEDRFAKSFNASPAAMTITRFEDGLYRNVNPRFIELLGYELEEIIDHTTLELNIYKNLEERHKILGDVRSNRGTLTYDTQLHTKTGQSLDVTISVVEIELEGEPHLLSIITDITERNRILTALRASEQQLRALFDVLPVGVSYVRPSGEVIQNNRTLEDILDLTAEEIKSGAYKSRQYVRSNGTPMPAAEFASARALKEQRTIKNVETGIIKESGQVIWTSVSAAPISVPEPGVVVITADVTEQKHLDDELRRSHRRYQILSQRLVEIQEEERRTISRELHDRVGQSLAALNLNLSFMNSWIPDNSNPQIKLRLKDAIQLTEETVSTIRDVMANLRPPALDDYGLEAALNAYADTFSRRFGIRVVLDKATKPLPRIHPSIELTLLRIAQEALTNVARHANATKATIRLSIEGEMVYLTVEDNGDGIRSWQRANRPGSHGLKIMRERAETFGGTLQVQSFSQKGTKIEVKIPFDPGDTPKSRAEEN